MFPGLWIDRCNCEVHQPSVECVSTPRESTKEPSDLPHSYFNVDVWKSLGRGCGRPAGKSRTWEPFSCTPPFGSNNTTDRKRSFIANWRLLYPSLPPPDEQSSELDARYRFLYRRMKQKSLVCTFSYHTYRKAGATACFKTGSFSRCLNCSGDLQSIPASCGSTVCSSFVLLFVPREKHVRHPATALQAGSLVLTWHVVLTEEIVWRNQSGNLKSSAINTHFVRFEVLKAVTLKTDVFCGVTQCSLAMFYQSTRRHILEDNSVHK